MPTIDLHAVFEGQSHLDWAASVARQIAVRKGFDPDSQEAADLVQVAHTILYRRTIGDRGAGFDWSRVPTDGDPIAAFRGYVHHSIKWECIRRAQDLKKGGIKTAQKLRLEKLPQYDEEIEREPAMLVQPVLLTDDEPEGLGPPLVEEYAIDPAPKPMASWCECSRCGGRCKLKANEPRQCVRCGSPVAA